MAFNPAPQKGTDQKDPNQKRGSGGLKTLVQAESMLQIAIALPVAVLIGTLAGAALDRWLHQHWIVIVGVFLGAAGGISAVVRIASQAGREK